MRISRATRESAELELGASPRATMALYQASQAWAGIQGRDYILPDDIKRLVLPVMGHRLIVSPQAQLHGRSAEEMIKDIIAAVPVPVES